jgi:hypothetical protein
MRMRSLGIAAAIIGTLGFSCHNEPNYPTPGMSNPPGGSGSGIASVTSGGPAASPTPASSPAAPSQPGSNKSAAQKKRP